MLFFIPFIHVRVRRQHVHPHHVNILNTITSNEFKILKEFVADDDFSEFMNMLNGLGLKNFAANTKKAYYSTFIDCECCTKGFFFHWSIKQVLLIIILLSNVGNIILIRVSHFQQKILLLFFFFSPLFPTFPYFPLLCDRCCTHKFSEWSLSFAC